MQADNSKTEIKAAQKIFAANPGSAYQLAKELEDALGFWPLPLISMILSGARRGRSGKSKTVLEAILKRASEIKDRKPRSPKASRS